MKLIIILNLIILTASTPISDKIQFFGSGDYDLREQSEIDDFIIEGYGFRLEPKEEKTIQEDFSDFLLMIPDEHVKNITKKFYENDFEFKKFIDFCKSNKFSSAISSLRSNSNVKMTEYYLNKFGLQISWIIETVEKLLGFSGVGGEFGRNSGSYSGVL